MQCFGRCLLPGQEEDRIDKKQSLAVEGRQPRVRLITPGTTDEPKCSPNPPVDHRLNYVLDAMPRHFHVIQYC